MHTFTLTTMTVAYDIAGLVVFSLSVKNFAQNRQKHTTSSSLVGAHATDKSFNVVSCLCLCHMSVVCL